MKLIDAAVKELKKALASEQFKHDLDYKLATQWQERVEQAEARAKALECCGNCKHLKWDHRFCGDAVVRQFSMCGAVKHEERVISWDPCHFTPSRWEGRTG